MVPRALLLAVLVIAPALAASCTEEGASRRPLTGSKRTTTDPTTGKALPDYNDPHVTAVEGLPDPFEGLLHGQQQNDALCTRMGSTEDTNPLFNAVTSMLCVKKVPVASLVDVQGAFGLTFPKTDPSGTNGSNQNPAFAFLGHSNSLVARSVSSINPRAFVFTPPAGQPTKLPGFVIYSFTRGEQFLEVAAQSPKADNRLTFYLIKFDLPCGNKCGNADLLTPAVESNWSNITVYDDEDLKNTLLDCRECHQPNGPSQGSMLRMQEVEDPWTHWFRSDRPGGLALLQDYFRAHSDQENYAGVPGDLINKSDGRAFEDFIKGQGFDQQPNSFDTKTIEAEVQDSSTLQPEINKPPGKSATWDAIFNNAFLGNAIPVPYHDVKVTDPDNLQYATNSYRDFMASGGGQLADIRRVFLSDALEEMTFLPKSGASGREVIVQTCAQCHNPRLDQSLSRAKFDATNLDGMSREEKNTAIARLNLAPSNLLHMPPAFIRSLPDDARAAAIEALGK